MYRRKRTTIKREQFINLSLHLLCKAASVIDHGLEKKEKSLPTVQLKQNK